MEIQKKNEKIRLYTIYLPISYHMINSVHFVKLLLLPFPPLFPFRLSNEHSDVMRTDPHPHPDVQGTP